jgi:predicted acylesterase/phospholipase RssA
VLSAGGVRGVYAHTGFLQAIESLDVPIAAIAGCSAGSIVGGIYASGTPLSQWVEALNQMKREDFWQPGSWGRSIWEMFVYHGHSFTGVSATDAAMVFCRSQLTVERFDQCRVPFHALATSLTSGGKVFFSDGELAPRIVASSSIPLLYQPVEIDGEFYCDGGVINLAPTEAICCIHDLDVLLVHHVATRTKGFRGVKETDPDSWPMVEILDTLLFRTRPWYLSDKAITFRNCPCGCRVLIVALEPELLELPWPQTELGPTIQQQAMSLVTTLLDPHIEALRNNPESLRHLVLPSQSNSMEVGRC